MEQKRPARGSATYDVLVVVLATVVIIGGALFFMAFGPRGPAAFEVGPGEKPNCPSDKSDPNCYVFKIENTGGTEGYLRCRVKPTGDSKAEFSNDDPTYRRGVPMVTGESYLLFTKVTAGPSREIPKPIVATTTTLAISNFSRSPS